MARGTCKGVEVELEGITVTVDTFLFELEGIDLVLGIAWLATLGEILVDWGRQTLKFQLKGEWVELKGEGSTYSAQIALQSFFGKPRRLIGGIFLSAEMQLTKQTKMGTKTADLEPKQQEELQELLRQYSEVFKESKGLPPRRGKEHAIISLEGQGLVNV